MSLRIKTVDPLGFAAWDQFVLGFSGYTFFHSAGWSRVLKETYGYQPIVLRIDDQRQTVAVFSLMQINSFLTGKRGVSMPFSDFCASLFLDEDVSAEAVGKLLDFGRENKWKYVELRGRLASLGEHSSFASYYHHELELDENADLVSRRFRSSTKRNIRKSINEGVEVNISTSPEAVETFYALNCITRRRHGLPPQPVKLFRKIYEHVVSRGNGFIVTAEWQGKVIGAALYTHFGGKTLYKYGASDHSSQQLRANNLIMWEAIKWYCQNGYKTLSLGRTDIDHEGLLQFKRGWGAKEEIIPYYRFDPQSRETIQGYHKNGAFKKYSSKLPVAVLKALGTVMYRHAG